MGQTVDGGTFRTRVGAARMFGLVETSAAEPVEMKIELEEAAN
jgi:hypothetical protein